MTRTAHARRDSASPSCGRAVADWRKRKQDVVVIAKKYQLSFLRDVIINTYLFFESPGVSSLRQVMVLSRIYTQLVRRQIHPYNQPALMAVESLKLSRTTETLGLVVLWFQHNTYDS